MPLATTYQEWYESATALDDLLGFERWKAERISTEFDFNLISHRLQKMRDLRLQANEAELLFLLRSGFLRNLGGIGNPRLFSRSLTGTKHVITSYLNEIVHELEQFAKFDGLYRGISVQKKVEFLHDSKQSFGHTALILEGGASFGLFHLGAVKALSEQSLLPRIISGSSVGALIAALVCVHSERDLPRIFEPNGIDLKAFAKKDIKGNITRKVTRLLKHGYLMDVKVLENCVRSNVGDLTFEEAFQISNRVLNITVSSTRKYEIPRLLNYLTAPNVLIWSAACASAAMIGLYESVELLAKDNHGNIVHWSPSAISWSDSTGESETLELKLAEQFNVNHFILSQASPHIAPFLPKWSEGQPETILSKVSTLLSSEIRHRIMQICEIGVAPKSLLSLLQQRSHGQGYITIAPTLSSTDFYQLFSNPTYDSLNYWVLKGEQATWPVLSFIHSRTQIEYALDRVYRSLKLSLAAVDREM
ncbi:acyl transferase/acyl hydrolase/lysophospholipase [Phlyctochytrium arcticum]|nr:acyl transferase/acyl hydrolase/lysophospholipase [Phlyctochytrium arcticum]